MLALIGFVALVAIFAALPFGHWTRPLLPHRPKDQR